MTTTGQLPPTRADLVERYNAIHATVDTMGKTLLKLMRHPETTAEQIDEGRLKYFLTYTAWIDARMTLRERYPDTVYTMKRPLPWNRDLED